MSKAEQLRAMREAQAERTDVPKRSPAPVAKKAKTVAKRKTKIERITGPRPKKAIKKSMPKKKANNGRNFKANKVKGRPATDKAHLTNEARKPWEAMGVSRRTWYRHQATGGT